LLWRWKTGELNVHIPVVISNHETLRGPVEAEEIPFLHLPVTPERRAEQEALLLAALREHRVNLVVLARYMQILSPLVVDAYPERIINIHHSFLPAFAGAKPYHQAYERGVKIIGATSHYVTSELDQGPIIAQAVAHVDHRDTVDELVRKGRDLERLVFATAVRLHAEDKVLVSRNKTVVFD
jgi:formyltetrahydrofolate deformylase